MSEHKVVIDVEARFDDNLTRPVSNAEKALHGFEDAVKSAASGVDNLAKKKAKPSIDVDDNPFLRKMKSADDRVRKFIQQKAPILLTAKDKASSIIEKIQGKVKQFAGKTYSALVKIRDSEALYTLKKVGEYSKRIAGKTWTAAIKVKDFFTSPLTKLKNQLFSVKTLVAGVMTGMAAQKFVINPTQMYANKEDLVTQFAVLLKGEGSSTPDYEAANKRLDELTTFAGETPFTRDEIYQASRVLQTYTQGALATPDATGGLRMIGDIAAATGQEYTNVATYMGRLYNETKRGGETLGEPLAALREMGALSAEQEEKIREIAQGSGTIEDKWQAIAAQFSSTDGMMKEMSNQMNNLMLGVKSFFKNNLYMKLGEGISESLKPFLIDFRTWRSENKDLIAEWAAGVKNFAALASDKVLGVLRKIGREADKVLKSDAFQEADIFGKIGMLWKGAIGNPLAEWWNETLAPWWDNTAAPWFEKQAARAGESIGKGLTTGLLALLGVDVVGAAEDGVNIGASFAQGFVDGFDGGAITQAFLDAIANIWDGLPAWAKLVLGGMAVSKGAGMVSGIAGGVTNAVGVGKHVLGFGTKAAGAFGIGATGAAGSLLGLGATAGGLLGGAGIIDGLIDIYHGIKAGKGKERKDDYVKGGTKLGMVGAGAAAGAAIGSVVPVVGTAAGALIGAGVGGIGALLKGNDVGKWISDATDGWGEAIKGFFTETVPAFFTEKIPEAASKAGDAISDFFTVTIPEKWTEFWDGVGNFFTETIPYALGFAAGKIYAFFTETLPAKWTEFWDSVGNFFAETVPAAIGLASEKISEFFTVSIPEKWTAFWDTIDAFFTETLPTWASDTWTNNIVPFFSETIPAKVSEMWNTVTEFFTEAIPSIAETIWGAVKTFFTETIPAKVREIWDSVTGFFSGIGASITAGFTAGNKARGGLVYPSGSNVPGFAGGGLVGGAGRLVRVAEEGSPEMIIPLSSQRRQRGMSLWAKAGQMLGVSGDAGIRNREYGGAGSMGGAQSAQIDIGGITFDISVTGGAGGDTGIVEAIRAQSGEIVDTVAGILADAFNAQFENTPVRGGVS